MDNIEQLRVVKLLETHFCDTLGLTFTFYGEPIAPVSVFDRDFLLGMACLIIDQSDEFSDPDYPLVNIRRKSESTLLGVEFRLNSLNGFRAFQVISVIESFFGISCTSYFDGDTEIELGPIIEGLLYNFIEQSEDSDENEKEVI